MLKAPDCSCGRYLEADYDEELFERAREHANTEPSRNGA